MKHHVFFTALLVAGLAGPVPSALAQGGAANTTLGTVTLSKKVKADGQPLAPGTYQVRLTGESPKPGPGQSPDAETYVEFLKAGKVVAREVASVVQPPDAAAVIKEKPITNGVKVETLKGDDYVRVWIAKGGTNYLINLPTGA